MAGTMPQTGAEVNYNVGTILRQFTDLKESIGHYRDSLATLQLQEPPYDMTPADETTIKTAINGLDDALDAVDMTFINRLTGLF